MIWAFGALVLFIIYLIRVGEKKGEAKALEVQVELDSQIDKKKNDYIQAVDTLVDKWKENDDKIRKAYKHSSADELNKLLSSQSNGPKTKKSKGSK